jgi:porphobilinogen synthase
MSDLYLDEFTDHGHCGVLAPEGTVDNDATLRRHEEMAVAHAEAGAHMSPGTGRRAGWNCRRWRRA